MTVHIHKDILIGIPGGVPGTSGEEAGHVRLREADRNGHIIVDAHREGSEVNVDDLREALDKAEAEGLIRRVGLEPVA